jgi:hypothetical protein
VAVGVKISPADLDSLLVQDAYATPP